MEMMMWMEGWQHLPWYRWPKPESRLKNMEPCDGDDRFWIILCGHGELTTSHSVCFVNFNRYNGDEAKISVQSGETIFTSSPEITPLLTRCSIVPIPSCIHTEKEENEWQELRICLS